MDEKLIDRAVAEIKRLTRIEEPVARIAATITVMVAQPPPFMVVPDLSPEEVARLGSGRQVIYFVPKEPKPHMDRFWKQMADVWAAASNSWRAVAERYKKRLDEIEAALPDGPIYWSDDERTRFNRIVVDYGAGGGERPWAMARDIADAAVKMMRERASQ